MLTDLGTRKIIVKVVYFGAAMSGKTTSLRYIFKKFGRDLQSIENQAGRTLFWDHGTIPIQKGQWTFEISVWSCTGQNFYAETRPTVLEGVDGIIFVADSQLNLIGDNKASWSELSLMLGDKWKKIPITIILNKRDSPNAVSMAEFKNFMGLNNSTAIFETIATEGINVMESFRDLIQRIFNYA